MNEPKFGVWITNVSGEPDGRWMTDGSKDWCGSEFQAASYARSRRSLYRHVNYEVKEVEPDATPPGTPGRL